MSALSGAINQLTGVATLLDVAYGIEWSSQVQLPRSALIVLRGDVEDRARGEALEQQGVTLREQSRRRPRQPGDDEIDEIVNEWIAEACVLGPALASAPIALYDACRAWAQEHGERVPTPAEFRRAIERVEGVAYVTIKDRRRVRGLGLQSEVETAVTTAI